MAGKPLAAALRAAAEALSALAQVVEAGAAEPRPSDDLVALNAAGLAAIGLELRSIQKLVAAGRLRAVEIGRRRFTKRSYLLALVDELPAAVRKADEDGDALRVAVAKAGQRRALSGGNIRRGRGRR